MKLKEFGRWKCTMHRYSTSVNGEISLSREMVFVRKFDIFLHYFYYRSQQSWAKVIFSQACVKNSVHGGEGVCLSACWDTPPPKQTPQPPWTRPPHGPGRHPPGPDPPDQTPPGPDTPQTRQTPPQEADCSIRSTSGWYASYWNAFLFTSNFQKHESQKRHPLKGNQKKTFNWNTFLDEEINLGVLWIGHKLTHAAHYLISFLLISICSIFGHPLY